MAKWYNTWLNDDEKHKQISTKASIARRRKRATEANARSISNAGYISDADRQRYYETKARLEQEFENRKQEVKNMTPWERKKAQQDALNKKSKITNR